MVEIERAAVQDVLTIKELLRETWHDTYGSLLPTAAMEAITSQWHAPELLEEQLQDPEIYFAVAREGGNIVGVITARKQDDAIVVNRLYVRPQCQRRGIGRQLLESSYRTFHDARRVRLNVEAENRQGVAFYAKQGFRETARSFEQVAGACLENVVMERPFVPVAADVPRITVHSAADIVNALRRSLAAHGLMLTEEDLGRDFYDLKTGLAGALFQKVVNYRGKLAIVIRDPHAYGERFGELAYEHRAHPAVRFFADRAQAQQWLDPSRPGVAIRGRERE